MPCHIDILVEDARWRDAGLDRLAPTACTAALETAGLNADACEISLLGCNDAKIAQLNKEFRARPQPTNVLSWPAHELAADVPGQAPKQLPLAPDGAPTEIGDIAIAYDTCAREAADLERDLGFHVTHLVIHATLHLLGYDHILEQDAVVMERLERESLATLGFPDPYAI